MMCGNPGVHGRGVPDGVMLDGTCLVRCAGAVWRSMTWYASILPVGLLLNVRALPAFFLCTVFLDAFDEQVFPCGWAFPVR